MEEKKQKLIKRQKFVVRTFWIMLAATIGIILGSVMTQGEWVDYEYGGGYLYNPPGLLLRLIIFLDFIVLIILLTMFFAIGKKTKPKSNEVLEQIEKLGKLKEQGHITDDEFEKEKKKLWDN